MKNYYSILGLQDYAAFEKIKPAYRKMAMLYHPDKHENNELKHLSEEKFREVTEAYENLKTEDEKKRYDNQLRNHYNRRNSGSSDDYYRSDEKKHQESREKEAREKEERQREAREKEERQKEARDEEVRRKESIKCYIHPNVEAVERCSICNRPFCSECLTGNQSNMCVDCSYSVWQSLKKELIATSRKVIFIPLLFVVLINSIMTLKGILINAALILAITLNANEIKTQLTDSRKMLISRVMLVLMKILIAIVKLPPMLVKIYIDFYVAKRDYKSLSGKQEYFTMGMFSVSHLTLVLFIVFTIFSGVQDELIVNTEAAEKLHNNEILLHLKVETFGEKGVKGTYIERVDPKLSEYLLTGLYYDGSDIKIYKKGDKFYLALFAHCKTERGLEKVIDFDQELIDVNRVKFHVCNNYMQVYANETEHRSIEESVELPYITQENDYIVDMSIE